MAPRQTGFNLLAWVAPFAAARRRRHPRRGASAHVAACRAGRTASPRRFRRHAPSTPPTRSSRASRRRSATTDERCIVALVVGTVLAIGALAFVLYPLFFEHAASRARAPTRRVESWSDDVAVAALREIEFDRATGKLSDADYAELKERYTRRRWRAMRARPRRRSERRTDDELEAAIRAYRAERPACRPAGRVPSRTPTFCSNCGRYLPAGAQQLRRTCRRARRALLLGLRPPTRRVSGLLRRSTPKTRCLRGCLRVRRPRVTPRLFLLRSHRPSPSPPCAPCSDFALAVFVAARLAPAAAFAAFLVASFLVWPACLAAAACAWSRGAGEQQSRDSRGERETLHATSSGGVGVWDRRVDHSRPAISDPGSPSAVHGECRA